jgi:hypothetical protein
MSQVFGALRRFNRWSEDMRARYPARFGACFSLVMLLTVTTLYWASGPPYVSVTALLIFAAIYVVWFTGMSAFLWRKGGPRQRRYEAKRNPHRVAGTLDTVLPHGGRYIDPLPGWYRDPLHTRRLRYWTANGWSDWVADNGDPYLDREAG